MSDIDPFGVEWWKSRASAVNGNCVEVACLPGRRIAVRDSKDRTGPVLIFDGSGWAAFIAGVKGGDFDL
ncbi:DUF397 domain-containing protein [Streptosporangium lutulentum]|uniref:DUF397 domain-containing protein n=1 Tax=Streptosporangium lutulentum TaxID=1461250 RepID=A0ABT9QLT4_9ACTN|nr:DUF397 domain-containing protein [Streptosporangium lutulentum]MDP9847340.1 hypothetical protein [Streptosporangium lutulentum]